MGNVLHLKSVNGNDSVVIKDLVGADVWIGFDIYFVGGLPPINGNSTGYIASTADASHSQQDGLFIRNYVGTVKWETDYSSNGPFASVTASSWIHIDFRSVPGIPINEDLWVDSIDQSVGNVSNNAIAIGSVGFGSWFSGGWETSYELYIRNIKVGSTQGASNIWTTNLSGAIGTIFDSVVVGAGDTLEIIADPTIPVIPATPTLPCSKLWRFLVTDLGGSSITLLDHLSSERMVTPLLNEPLEVSGTVPSDSNYVNRTHTDGFPLLAEGVRLLYCFRRESEITPYYTIRASTLIMQVNDASGTGDARTRFTGWDPWQYLFSRPVLQSPLAIIGNDPPLGSGASGLLIPKENMFYPPSVSADDIITNILFEMLSNGDVTAPGSSLQGFVDWGLSGSYTGTIEACPAPGYNPEGWEIQQGTSVGQALQDICASGACDIIMEPIYDPVNRPGLLCQMSVYTQGSPGNGAGVFNYNAIFAWDRPGRSAVGVDNLYDGSSRANHILYYYGQGGPPIAAFSSAQFRDAVSIATYGEFAISRFFPGQDIGGGVKSLAAQQLDLRANFKQTLTVNPAPERSPEPFVDYYLGDRVPVYVSSNMRQPLPGAAQTNANVNALNSVTVVVHSTDGFVSPAGTFVLGGVNVTYTGTTATSFTGCSSHPATLGGERVVAYGILAWQRIYGIPVEIDDNGVETVRELLVGPVGGPPPVVPPGQSAPSVNTQVAITTARMTNRQGGVGP